MCVIPELHCTCAVDPTPHGTPHYLIQPFLPQQLVIHPTWHPTLPYSAFSAAATGHPPHMAPHTTLFSLFCRSNWSSTPHGTPHYLIQPFLPQQLVMLGDLVPALAGDVVLGQAGGQLDPIVEVSTPEHIVMGVNGLPLLGNKTPGRGVMGTTSEMLTRHSRVGMRFSYRCRHSPGSVPSLWSGEPQSENTRNRTKWSERETGWPHPLCFQPYQTYQSSQTAQQHPCSRKEGLPDDKQVTTPDIPQMHEQLSHDNTQPSHDNTQPSHDNTQPSHDNTQPSHDNTQPSHDNTQPSHDNTQPSHDNTQPSHDNTQPSHDNTT